MGFPSPVQFAPSRACRSDDPRPKLSFISPEEGATISENPLEIFAIVDATQGFESMRLEFGQGERPIHWEILTQSRERLPIPEVLHVWDLNELPEGLITLRLKMKSTLMICMKKSVTT